MVALFLTESVASSLRIHADNLGWLIDTLRIDGIINL